MTPEAARDLYYLERYKAIVALTDHNERVDQDKCDLAGWAAVIEAIQVEISLPPSDHMR